jgi:hypothetical protein
MDGKELPMIHKSLITCAAAAAFLSLSAVGSIAAAPFYAEAPAVKGMDYKQDARHYVVKCKIVRVKTDYGWKKVEKCRKVYRKHYGY